MQLNTMTGFSSTTPLSASRAWHSAARSKPAPSRPHEKPSAIGWNEVTWPRSSNRRLYDKKGVWYILGFAVRLVMWSDDVIMWSLSVAMWRSHGPCPWKWVPKTLVLHVAVWSLILQQIQRSHCVLSMTTKRREIGRRNKLDWLFMNNHRIWSV